MAAAFPRSDNSLKNGFFRIISQAVLKCHQPDVVEHEICGEAVDACMDLVLKSEERGTLKPSTKHARRDTPDTLSQTNTGQLDNSSNSMSHSTTPHRPTNEASGNKSPTKSARRQRRSHRCYCGYTTATIVRLTAHRAHHDPACGKFRCDYCPDDAPYYAATVNAISHHITQNHPDKRQEYYDQLSTVDSSTVLRQRSSQNGQSSKRSASKRKKDVMSDSNTEASDGHNSEDEDNHKPYLCRFCPRSFHTFSGRLTHYGQQHKSCCSESGQWPDSEDEKAD